MTEERRAQLLQLVKDFPGKEAWEYHGLLRRKHGWRGFSTTVAQQGLWVLRNRGQITMRVSAAAGLSGDSVAL